MLVRLVVGMTYSTTFLILPLVLYTEHNLSTYLLLVEPN
jgi:hypothetical protein